jgi:serine/threonine protein kinase
VLLTAAMQVLDAMLQLQEHKMLHRDLALRNLLVFRFHVSDCDQVHIKLTDYGLAAQGSYVRMSTSSVGDGLPIRWMSPEAITHRRWSEKSDVWAFAVTLWEMFTHGGIPYMYIPSDEEVGRRVVQGDRPERPLTPTECPEEIFAVMLKCWQEKLAVRPTFADVKRMILSEFRKASWNEQQPPPPEEGECCICLESMLVSDLLALVPCGHRCVCANDTNAVVGRPCPLCRTTATQAMKVFDNR